MPMSGLGSSSYSLSSNNFNSSIKPSYSRGGSSSSITSSYNPFGSSYTPLSYSNYGGSSYTPSSYSYKSYSPSSSSYLGGSSGISGGSSLTGSSTGRSNYGFGSGGRSYGGGSSYLPPYSPPRNPPFTPKPYFFKLPKLKMFEKQSILRSERLFIATPTFGVQLGKMLNLNVKGFSEGKKAQSGLVEREWKTNIKLPTTVLKTVQNKEFKL
jgi:hypothetical protein